MIQKTRKAIGQYSIFRSWISLFGLVITLGSLFSFILLFAIDLMSEKTSPYLGILTFGVAPLFFVGGMVLIGVGWLLLRRKAIKNPVTPQPFLYVDLTRPDDRRKMVVFLLGTLCFLGFSAIGSYHTYHFAESLEFCGRTCHTPMKPENTTYLHSPHACVACTECHVGSGIQAYAKAKFNGVHQLYATLANDYQRPIPTPVKGMRIAQETCEECHWKKKYVGNVDRTFPHYLSDEDNTPYAVRLSIKVGGGDPTHGPLGGIHWHMNVTNKVEYIAKDDQHQEIPWVRFTSTNGVVTEYATKDFKIEAGKYTIRTMDCMDCHNRPAHQLQPPTASVDLALSLNTMDPSIKLIKSNAVALLSKTYATEDEGLKNIHDALYKLYPNQTNIAANVSALQDIFSKSIFPEMKSSWKVYPNNIGHKEWGGCFRCHDGLHKTADKAQPIRSNCNDCHTVVAQGKGDELAKLDAKGLKFAHPDPMTDGTDFNCKDCHGPEK